MFIDHEEKPVISFRSSARRGIAAAGLISVLALVSTACGALNGASDSEACDKVLSGGNVATCFGISDVSTSKGDAVVLKGTQVNIVCATSGGVGIVIPKEIVNADLSQVEWKYKGENAAKVDSSVFTSVPGGLPSCDKVLNRV
ncbi:MAG TPA: hypothetical protein VJ843_02155 [Candidatus Saccharimonadales bacterium]|nr:hypothetical protein [Candidatus Saccharimonadales bacterium]